MTLWKRVWWIECQVGIQWSQQLGWDCHKGRVVKLMALIWTLCSSIYQYKASHNMLMKNTWHIIWIMSNCIQLLIFLSYVSGVHCKQHPRKIKWRWIFWDSFFLIFILMLMFVNNFNGDYLLMDIIFGYQFIDSSID